MNNPKSYYQATFDQLSGVFSEQRGFKVSPVPTETPLIDDLLAWQVMMDNAPASINMYGAHRFWMAVAHYLGRPVYTNGSPDVTEVIIPLTDTVGLQLTATATIPYDPEYEPTEDIDDTVWSDLKYRFISLEGMDLFSP